MTSSGSATGNPRNKVGLKPGHSLMDWIRLGNSGKDLTGVGGVFLNISKSELERHNKKDDAWLCIRGKVYNVTHYMDFHPGGEEELMRGVGKDATQLFNQVHAWVNYESILQKCVIGRLEPCLLENTFTTPNSTISTPNTLKLPTTTNHIVPTSNPKPIQMDWFQQIGFLTLVFYTKCSSPLKIHVSLKNETNLCVVLNNVVKNINLEGGISWPSPITTDILGKVQVKLNKRKPGLWQTYGKLEPTEPLTLPEYFPVIVTNVVAINHNTKQIDFIYKNNVFNYIPMGHHILVKAVINGEEVLRPYTPVTGIISTVPPSSVRLLVKSYDSGTVSKWLCSLHKGESFEISCAQGSFNPTVLSSKTNLILLAAGTGITPMISIIIWALNSTKLKVNLLFFNKTEKDIIWHEQMDRLMSDNFRFNVEHILSDAGPEWIGKKGRINLTLLQSLLPESCKDIPNTHFVLICGPILFTQMTERYLKDDLHYTKDNYYCFLGS
uniref:Uncharacterized protein n=1 Tax=Clastoptera arizonana TaxID=38151 RepID=A0A1B6DYH6_9HEMI